MLKISNTSDRKIVMGVERLNYIEITWGKFEDLIYSLSGKTLIFVDPIVLTEFCNIINSDNKNVSLIPLNINENDKNIDSLKEIVNYLENNSIGRNSDNVIALGGGALIDVVSLACSLFRRGIKVIKTPTTLLGFVDAAIGIKTGINHLGQRNRLGTYHANFDVFLDTRFITTLNKSLITQGLGEIFKIATIKSSKLFELLEKNLDNLLDPDFFSSNDGILIIEESIIAMLEELHDNPEEKNLMRCVDFGHTFSPLVEMNSIKNHNFYTIPHGFAVAFDCILTSLIAKNRLILNDEDFERILNLFSKVNFNFKNNIYTDVNLMWSSLLEMTNHRGGSQNIPVPNKIGEYEFIQDLNFEEVSTAQKQFVSIFK